MVRTGFTCNRLASASRPTVDPVDKRPRRRLSITLLVTGVTRPAMRIDELFEHGALDGAATWRRMLAAVNELENTVSGGTVH